MKERKIGEVFGLEDVILRVEEPSKHSLCYDCYFNKPNPKYFCHDSMSRKCIGNCAGRFRSDGRDVVFVEVKGSGYVLDVKYMDFSHVLQYLKDGAVARRESWSGNKSIFLAKDVVGMLPFFCINTKDGHKGVYTATACDLLAEDWMVIEI